ncbi:C-type lectin domain family 4 member M-like [Parambassis ranga]|uniref:C-type lectin domain family 4 member M-like n=1 Tax=Parambassis ranga TaxID=210632 RepID=A0A6P7JYX4_9TELE|nr:C-type lectin domain family 4 member M-like [Parambassis ranga]
MAAYEEETGITLELPGVSSRHAASRNYTDEDLTDDVQVVAPVSDTSAAIKNLTEERDTLQNKLDICGEQHTAVSDRSAAKTADLEATMKNLTEERDTLQGLLDVFEVRHQQGWVLFQNSFYYISSDTKSWQDSKADCVQKGADLVIINSKEEQNFLRKFKKRVWIGLKETEGVWKWVDGTQLSISFWIPGEPNNNNFEGKDEDCGEIRSYDQEDGWNDTPCDMQRNWICEQAL